MRQKKSLFYLLILTLFLTFNLISCSGGGEAAERQHLRNGLRGIPLQQQ